MATTVTFTYGANALTITGDGVFDGPTYDRLEGWIGVDADLRFQPRPSAPGAFAPQQVYARDRLISLEGQYFGSSRADAIAMRERLLGLQNDGRPLTMTVADDLRTTSREVYVEQIAVPWTIHQEFRYAIDVRAADPRRYAPVVEVATNLASAGEGLILPLEFPVTFGIAGIDGRVTIVNAGNTGTGSRFTITGTMPDGFELVNVTTGQRITYLGPVALSASVTIDTRLRTALIEDTGPAGRFLASPEWWEVPAGSSIQVQFVARGPVSDSPIMTAATASAFY